MWSIGWKSDQKMIISTYVYIISLVEILLFATNHYATSVQLVVVYNYLGHVCNYKFGIILFLDHMVVWEINMQLNVYNMDTCQKNNGLN
jgi:hypothetical protein